MGAIPRVVSLVPAATEILRHLGVEPVAVSHCCENIGSGAAIATSSIIPDGLSQSAIDRFVSEATASGSSLYRVDEAVIARVQPDLIVTQGVCEVCAAGPGEVSRATACLPNNVPTLLLNGTRLDDLFADITAVSDAIGDNPSPTITALRARLDAVASAVAKAEKPNVSLIEWLDPPFLGGHWAPDMLTAAGANPVGPAPGEPSPRTTWQSIEASSTDALFFAFCGFSLADTLAALTTTPVPYRARLNFAIDARYTCQLTPHTVRGIEIMAGLLHPERYRTPSAIEARKI